MCSMNLYILQTQQIFLKCWSMIRQVTYKEADSYLLLGFFLELDTETLLQDNFLLVFLGMSTATSQQFS